MTSEYASDRAMRADLVLRPSWLTSDSVVEWLLAFVLILGLGADKGGYWPTAWGWTALVALLVAAVIVIARRELRIGVLEMTVPLALLGLTIWSVASAAWSASATQPVLQSQRTLMYAAVAFTSLLFARSRSYRPLLAGVCTAVTVICCYSLATRLFPGRVGSSDSIAGYRLGAPLGYWNALGIFAVLGTLLAVGFAARGRNVAVRGLASAATVALVPALYFTYSRGAWAAFAIGVVTMLALDSGRLQLVTTLAVVAPWPAIAVWQATRSEPLTHIGSKLTAIEHAGHRFAIYLAVLALAAALTMFIYAVLERRVRLPGSVRLVYAAFLLLAVIVGLALLTHRYGSPGTIAHKGYTSFMGPSRSVSNGDLNTRLFSLGGGERIPQWQVAWREYKAHPWLGSGAGSYERYWNEYRPIEFKVRNVHNLYLETLAELGPIGLGLLVIALAMPLVAAIRTRRRALVPAAAGAYVAFLGHAAVDWGWQIPGVTLAALFCGVAVLIASRQSLATPGRVVGRALRGTVLGLVVLLGVLAFVGLRGNRAIASSENAATRVQWTQSARDARSARSWAPWSSRPWQLLGEAQAALGNNAAARASFEHALRKNKQDWSIWLDLAVASNGAEQRKAFAKATMLNPLSPEIASWKPAGAKAK